MKILLITAMEKEANKIIENYKLKKIRDNFYENKNISLIITGITRNNVVKQLFELNNLYNYKTNEAILINVGLVGSNNLEIGEIISVRNSYGYHFDLTPFGDELYTAYNSPYLLNKIEELKNIDCYTSDGFVLKTNIKETCVFDMELNSITLFPHKKLYSIKIVSDTLNEKLYNEFNYDKSIEETLKYIDIIIKKEES